MDTIADTTGHDAFGFVHVEFEGTLDVADTALNFNSLDIDGNYLYAVGDSIFATISILDPLAPVCSSEYVIPGVNNLILEDVEVRGNFAFLVGRIITPGGGSDGILIVLNIGKPKEPTYVSSFIKRGTPTENHYFTAIDLEGNVAYVVDSFSNFYSIDITNYTTMSEIDNVAIDPGGHDIMVDGNWAYIACSHSIVSVNVESPGTLRVSAVVGPIGYVGDLYVDGDWLYVVCGDGSGYGLWKYDITDPTSITYYSSDYWYDCAIPYGVSIMGDWGYIMGYKLDNSTHPDTFSTIGVFDVTDNVDFVCSFNFMRELMRRLHKNGETMLYTVGRYFDGSGFVGAARAIRVGYPDSLLFTSPKYSSIVYTQVFFQDTIEPCQIEVKGDYSFVSDKKGMTTVRVKDPISPIQTAFYFESISKNYYFGIDVSGNYAFLSSSDIGGSAVTDNLVIIDISKPSPGTFLPKVGGARAIWHLNCDGEVEVDGNVAYLASIDTFNGTGTFHGYKRLCLDAFDISDVTRPIWLSGDTMLFRPGMAFFYYNQYFSEVEIEGDTAYVSWRIHPYDGWDVPFDIPPRCICSIRKTNNIGFFNLKNSSAIKNFLPRQKIITSGVPESSWPDTIWNLGFLRYPDDFCGGAIDVEGNIIYSTIGMHLGDFGCDSLKTKPVATNNPHYGLLRYSIDTTQGGYIYELDPSNGRYFQSSWIKYYRPLTNNGMPLELLVDGDYAFCSFNNDSLYVVKVDSVNDYLPLYNVIPIFNSNFNDFKTSGDYLYAVGESLLSISVYQPKFWSIKIFRRNHCLDKSKTIFAEKKAIISNKGKIQNINLSNSIKELYVYDILGRKVAYYKIDKKMNVNQIKSIFSKLPNGVYMIKIISENDCSYKKLVIIK